MWESFVFIKVIAFSARESSLWDMESTHLMIYYSGDNTVARNIGFRFEKEGCIIPIMKLRFSKETELVFGIQLFQNNCTTITVKIRTFRI